MDDIWFFTRERWGEGQADKYAAALTVAINALSFKTAADDGIPRVRHYFRVRVGRHNVYYRSTQNHVVIVRVLHESMDAGRHLV